jgi:hypothetical protein
MYLFVFSLLWSDREWPLCGNLIWWYFWVKSRRNVSTSHWTVCDP